MQSSRLVALLAIASVLIILTKVNLVSKNVSLAIRDFSLASKSFWLLVTCEYTKYMTFRAEWAGNYSLNLISKDNYPSDFNHFVPHSISSKIINRKTTLTSR